MYSILLINYLATRPYWHVRLLLLLSRHVGLCMLTDASCPVLITFSVIFTCTSSDITVRSNGSVYNIVVESFSISFYRNLIFWVKHAFLIRTKLVITTRSIISTSCVFLVIPEFFDLSLRNLVRRYLHRLVIRSYLTKQPTMNM